MHQLLSDKNTYTKVKSNPIKKTEKLMNRKFLNFKRKNKICDSTYLNIRRTHGLIPRIYGLIKVHKEIRPIVFMISF